MGFAAARGVGIGGLSVPHTVPSPRKSSPIESKTSCGERVRVRGWKLVRNYQDACDLRTEHFAYFLLEIFFEI